MDKWLPAKKVSDIKMVQPGHTRDKTSLSLAKLQITDLKTIRIINSISKAGNLLSVRRQMAGKRLRDGPGGWWLSERDLSSSRREPWPSRRGSSGASSSCEEENECQRKHHLLWRHLDLSEPYLESGVELTSRPP